MIEVIRQISVIALQAACALVLLHIIGALFGKRGD